MSNFDLQTELGPYFLEQFRLVLTKNGASAANEINSGCPTEYSIKYHVFEAVKYHVFEADIKLDLLKKRNDIIDSNKIHTEYQIQLFKYFLQEALFMIMVQKHQLANTEPPSLHAILNKFLNLNSTVHFGRSTAFWTPGFLSEFTEALENNPRLCLETRMVKPFTLYS